MAQGKAHVIDRAVRPTSVATNSEHNLFPAPYNREMQTQNSDTEIGPTKIPLNYGIVPVRVMNSSHIL